MDDVRVGIHLLIPQPFRPAVLARAGSSELPGGAATLPPNRPAIAAVVAVLRESLSLSVPVLETHVRWDEDDNPPPDATIPTLALTEPPPRDWQPPVGLEWRTVDGFSPDVPDLLASRAAALIDEMRLGEGSAPPPLRPRWARPGWYERASRWMLDRLTEAGRPPMGPPEQTYLRGISALLRVETATGAAYLKAVFPPFAAEPAVTGLLAAGFPDLTPAVLAIEPTEGWLLMDDLGDVTVREEGALADHEAGVRALVTIQQGMATSTAALVALGCPRRPIRRLALELDRALGKQVTVETHPLAPDRRAQLVAWAAEAAIRVDTLAVPDTLVHGDFHPGNVALVHGRPVVFDWSDAAVGNPLVDLVTWLEEEDESLRERVIDACLDSWSSALDPAAARADLVWILGAGAAYQVVSYVGILEHLEPATRYTFADGLVQYVARLESAVPA